MAPSYTMYIGLWLESAYIGPTSRVLMTDTQADGLFHKTLMTGMRTSCTPALPSLPARRVNFISFKYQLLEKMIFWIKLTDFQSQLDNEIIFVFMRIVISYWLVSSFWENIDYILQKITHSIHIWSRTSPLHISAHLPFFRTVKFSVSSNM